MGISVRKEYNSIFPSYATPRLVLMRLAFLPPSQPVVDLPQGAVIPFYCFLIAIYEVVNHISLLCYIIYSIQHVFDICVCLMNALLLIFSE